MLLPKATYYDRLKRNKKPDKYADLKQLIEDQFRLSEGTYGYRRMHFIAKSNGFTYSPNTVRRLMRVWGYSVEVYSRHTNRYNSYHGDIGKKADNILKQNFSATIPFTVLHTDVSQVKLANGQWGYISAVIDQASHEVITMIVSDTANKIQLHDTLKDLSKKLSRKAQPILHSDQGWQYQLTEYHQTLQKMNITPSMSRKGKCHDNAPIESFFNLLKRECLNRKRIDSIGQLKEIVRNYQFWFNNIRISMKLNGLTPVAYRNQKLV